jgi:hypothetical protein
MGARLLDRRPKPDASARRSAISAQLGACDREESVGASGGGAVAAAQHPGERAQRCEAGPDQPLPEHALTIRDIDRYQRALLHERSRRKRRGDVGIARDQRADLQGGAARPAEHEACERASGLVPSPGAARLARTEISQQCSACGPKGFGIHGGDGSEIVLPHRPDDERMPGLRQVSGPFGT